MRVIDPGHIYELASFDGGSPIALTFVKRNSPPEKYPGNHNAHPGTQTQEVLRALIDRSLYVDAQSPCSETKCIVGLLRSALVMLERRHDRTHAGIPDNWPIEEAPFCVTCGHLSCFCEGVH